ncbi:hypothetical protein CC117_14265 [Parafrankia colletiae]|uniref:Uncharacterized protein n=1 Tax=Parafrankia colletiae TaxID=573497 RepID=A0A1S1R492_9ACTN|nr:DUF3710 domain-containing protein [Parafrankia colletiae]MCK9903762.1 DUF3710 domain-containing protein [Frankia sp. Cpl3]OHV40315.1 hypothetical protein CC117_14265 [Parafrankia colletiae]
MFGRRRPAADGVPSEPGQDAEPGQGAPTHAGPWGEVDAARLDPSGRDASAAASRHVDFGALRVAVQAGMTAEVLPGLGERSVPELVLRTGEFTVRMAAFAAPRSHDGWEGIRGDHAAAPGASGVVSGRYGPEFRSGDSRVIGIAGPRWYLRVAVTTTTTASAGDDATTALPVLDEILGATVVVRGATAMPAGAALPLRHPTPDGPAVVTLSDLWTDDPTTAGTGTLERRPAVHEYAGAFTGSLSRDLSTWG